MNDAMITDIRILKTKRTTRKALITLLKNKKFDQITVKDICQQAEISRGTFYLHYKDKYDLVYQYQIDMMQKGSEKVKQLIDTDRNLLFFNMINFWNNEAELLLLLISKNGSVDIQNQVKSMLQNHIEKNILYFVNPPRLNEKEKHYFAIFLSNAVFGIIQEWVNNGQQETPQELATIINIIVPESWLRRDM
ncbi:TetR/AcrR family transcriptional regulator [Staphylococcus sp. FSL K6-3157]|uniref:TetR/AcrR family transcriptional regulator n=1 Tax=Staphylococcus sp. FSL K6-3157 TaxID=2921490 RepID=UPI0030FA1F83